MSRIHMTHVHLRRKKFLRKEQLSTVRAATLALFLHILIAPLGRDGLIFRPRVFLNNFPRRRRQPRAITYKIQWRSSEVGLFPVRLKKEFLLEREEKRKIFTTRWFIWLIFAKEVALTFPINLSSLLFVSYFDSSTAINTVESSDKR